MHIYRNLLWAWCLNGFKWTNELKIEKPAQFKIKNFRQITISTKINKNKGQFNKLFLAKALSERIQRRARSNSFI